MAPSRRSTPAVPVFTAEHLYGDGDGTTAITPNNAQQEQACETAKDTVNKPAAVRRTSSSGQRHPSMSLAEALTTLMQAGTSKSRRNSSAGTHHRRKSSTAAAAPLPTIVSPVATEPAAPCAATQLQQLQTHLQENSKNVTVSLDSTQLSVTDSTQPLLNAIEADPIEPRITAFHLDRTAEDNTADFRLLQQEALTQQTQSAYALLQQQHSKLQQRQQQMELILIDMNHQLTLQEKNNHSLKARSTSQSQEIAHVAQDRNRLQQWFDSVVSGKDSSIEENSLFSQAYQDLTIERNLLQTQVQWATEHIQELETQLNAVGSRLAFNLASPRSPSGFATVEDMDVSNQLNALKCRYNELLQDNASLTHFAHVHELQATYLASTVAELRRISTDTEAEAAMLEANLQALTAKHLALHQQHAVVSQHLDVAQQDNELLTVALQHQEQVHEVERDAIQTEAQREAHMMTAATLETMMVENNTLQTTLVEMHQRHESVEHVNAELKQENMELHVELLEHKINVDTLQDQLEVYQHPGIPLTPSTVPDSLTFSTDSGFDMLQTRQHADNRLGLNPAVQSVLESSHHLLHELEMETPTSQVGRHSVEHDDRQAADCIDLTKGYVTFDELIRQQSVDDILVAGQVHDQKLHEEHEEKHQHEEPDSHVAYQPRYGPAGHPALHLLVNNSDDLLSSAMAKSERKYKIRPQVYSVPQSRMASEDEETGLDYAADYEHELHAFSPQPMHSYSPKNKSSYSVPHSRRTSTGNSENVDFDALFCRATSTATTVAEDLSEMSISSGTSLPHYHSRFPNSIASTNSQFSNSLHSRQSSVFSAGSYSSSHHYQSQPPVHRQQSSSSSLGSGYASNESDARILGNYGTGSNPTNSLPMSPVLSEFGRMSYNGGSQASSRPSHSRPSHRRATSNVFETASSAYDNTYHTAVRMRSPPQPAASTKFHLQFRSANPTMKLSLTEQQSVQQRAVDICHGLANTTYLGMELSMTSAGLERIQDVHPNSAAAKAGLRAGDLLPKQFVTVEHQNGKRKKTKRCKNLLQLPDHVRANDIISFIVQRARSLHSVTLQAECNSLSLFEVQYLRKVADGQVTIDAETREMVCSIH